LYEGFEVGLYYDPMLAKLIVWGETRGQAILRMRRALSEYKLLGIRTTIPFHLRMMESPSFIGGRLDTRFLERTSIMETNVTGQHGLIAALAAAAVTHHRRTHARATPAGDERVGRDPAESPWKLAGRPGLRRL